MTVAHPYGVREATVVFHANNSVLSLGDAQAVLHTIEGPAVMALGPTVGCSHITVRTKSDLTIIPPPARTSTSTTTTKPGHHLKATTTTTTRSLTQFTVVDPAKVKAPRDARRRPT